MKSEKVLVSGMAGFIGFHFARRLLNEGFEVIGIDNINDYYDVKLKYARLGQLGLSEAQLADIQKGADSAQTNQPSGARLVFYRTDLRQAESLENIFANHRPERVVHLAAQAGVRYSLVNPRAYIDSNIVGFMNILEGCRLKPVKHLVYASSSSVYGANQATPFSVHHHVDHPLSLYAVSKKANELMAHAYSHLYRIPTTGLRFFTVYGPWGRPDMALFIFTKKILAGEPIAVFNHGRLKRDFTFISDIVEGMWRVFNKIPVPQPDWDGRHPDPASSQAPYRIFNIGNQHPVDLLYFIELLEKKIGKKAIKEFLPLQAGDVVETCAEIKPLEDYIGFRPLTSIEEGMDAFLEWYREYHRK